MLFIITHSPPYPLIVKLMTRKSRFEIFIFFFLFCHKFVTESMTLHVAILFEKRGHILFFKHALKTFQFHQDLRIYTFKMYSIIIYNMSNLVIVILLYTKLDRKNQIIYNYNSIVKSVKKRSIFVLHKAIT